MLLIRTSPKIAKAIAVAGCCLALFAVTVARSSVAASVFKGNTLDHSWIIALAATLQQGQISGRDYFYTYGVLAQIIAWLGTWLSGGNSALDSFFSILLSFQSATIILFGVLLALIRQVNWKQVLFISLAMGLLTALFQYAAFRMMLVLLCAVLLQRVMSAEAATRRMLAAFMGIVCLIAQLVTAELGIQIILAAAVVLGAYAVFAVIPLSFSGNGLLSSSHYLSVFGIILGTFVVGNLVVSILFKLSSPSYERLFDYQWYNLEIIRGYNYTMGIPWKLSPRVLWGVFFVILCATAFVLVNLRRFEVADGYLLFSLLISSWVVLKGMTLRSDWGHTTLALIPMTFLLVVMGLSRLETTRWRSVWISALVVLFAIWPGASFSVLTQGSQILAGELPVATKLRQILLYRAAAGEYIPADLVEALSDSSRPMLNFPYQNYIGIGLQRELIAPVLQAHIAHTQALQQKYIEMLADRANALDVVYGLDFVASWPVDNVQHITRIPIIFEYLYRNFELQPPQVFNEGYFLLRPRQQSVNLPSTTLSYTIKQASGADVVLKLDDPTACSLVRLNMRLSYPFIAILGRPNALHLRFFLRDALVMQSDLVAIETGGFFTTFVSLIDAPEFYKVFGTMQNQSKEWDMLQVSPRVSGLLGVSPDRVDVGKIECIRLDEP